MRVFIDRVEVPAPEFETPGSLLRWVVAKAERRKVHFVFDDDIAKNPVLIEVWLGEPPESICQKP